MTEISIRTAEIEMKLHLDHIFTTFRQTAESPVRRSRRPVAADKAAISFGHGLRTHQPSGRQICYGCVALAFADTVTHPCGIDAGIDHKVRHVDILRTERAPRRRATTRPPCASMSATKGASFSPS